MSFIPDTFTPNSLYIAGFTQARAPHVALIIPTDVRSGALVHIRIDRTTSPTWAFQHRTQKIEGDMFLSSLMKIHDASAGPVGAITLDQLLAAAAAVPVPDNDRFGECSVWVYNVVEELHRLGLVTLLDKAALQKDFDAFAAGNRAFARRDRFPNVAESKYCT